ncbi:MAG TPA: hypothetical protein VN688_03265 [Gemmataceae bacterium]|nr:hypothetical protein [Gemmataceae bacterium]
MAWSWLAFWRLFHRGPSVERARRLFSQQREHLELQFFQSATASGKPRGLRWKAIDWESGVEFARELESGRLAALVGVTIQFEAIEGSDMEGLPAVGNLRNASAVFFFHGDRWHTIGKTVFNLNPDEALIHFKNQYERLPHDV